MKIIIRAHVITAILGWILALVLADVLIRDGDGLAAIAALFLLGVATAITIVDVLSVYFTRRGKALFLLTISTAFWGLVLVLYGLGLFSPNQPWQSRVVFAVLAMIAFFKIKASNLLLQIKKNNQNDNLVG